MSVPFSNWIEYVESYLLISGKVSFAQIKSTEYQRIEYHSRVCLAHVSANKKSNSLCDIFVNTNFPIINLILICCIFREKMVRIPERIRDRTKPK